MPGSRQGHRQSRGGMKGGPRSQANLGTLCVREGVQRDHEGPWPLRRGCRLCPGLLSAGSFAAGLGRSPASIINRARAVCRLPGHGGHSTWAGTLGGPSGRARGGGLGRECHLDSWEPDTGLGTDPWDLESTASRAQASACDRGQLSSGPLGLSFHVCKMGSLASPCLPTGGSEGHWR